MFVHFILEPTGVNVCDEMDVPPLAEDVEVVIDSVVYRRIGKPRWVLNRKTNDGGPRREFMQTLVLRLIRMEDEE